MKATIDHLPESKQAELQRIVDIVREHCNDVEMIILFGSYARGDYKVAEDLKPNRRSGHVSDYDILTVCGDKQTVEDHDLWARIEKACEQSNFSAHARIIVHDIQALNIKLAEGQYFFSDIRKEGCLLFDAGNVRLAEQRELTGEEKRRIAQDNFDNWFERATNFHKLFKYSLDNDMLKEAAFNLHQVAEACYKTLLLVLTNYNPNEHRLGVLEHMIVKEDTSFKNAIPRKAEEDQNRFLLLDFAYIGARYEPSYRISREDLEILAGHVELLMEKTRRVCGEKIGSFI